MTSSGNGVPGELSVTPTKVDLRKGVSETDPTVPLLSTEVLRFPGASPPGLRAGLLCPEWTGCQ